MNNLFSHLGLAMRAGKLVSGEEQVLRAIRSQKAKIVLLAMDASENTKKKFRDKCGTYGIPLYEIGTREQLGHSIGKAERAVVAITEPGLAGLVEKSLGN